MELPSELETAINLARNHLLNLNISEAGSAGLDALLLAETLLASNGMPAVCAKGVYDRLYKCLSYSAKYKPIADFGAKWLDPRRNIVEYLTLPELFWAADLKEESGAANSALCHALAEKSVFLSRLQKAVFHALWGDAGKSVRLVERAFIPQELLKYVEQFASIGSDPLEAIKDLEFPIVYNLVRSGCKIPAEHVLQRIDSCVLRSRDGYAEYLPEIELVRRACMRKGIDWIAPGNFGVFQSYTASVASAFLGNQVPSHIKSRNLVQRSDMTFIKYGNSTELLREMFATEAVLRRLKKAGCQDIVCPLPFLVTRKPHEPVAVVSGYIGDSLVDILKSGAEKYLALPWERIVNSLSVIHSLIPEQYAADASSPAGYINYLEQRYDLDMFTDSRNALLCLLNKLRTKAVCKDAHPGNFGIAVNSVKMFEQNGKAIFSYLIDTASSIVCLDFENLRWNTPHDDLVRLLEYAPYLQDEKIEKFTRDYVLHYNKAVDKAAEQGIKRDRITDVDRFVFEGYCYRPYFYALWLHNPQFAGEEFSKNKEYWKSRAVKCIDTLVTRYSGQFSSSEQEQIRNLKQMFA